MKKNPSKSKAPKKKREPFSVLFINWVGSDSSLIAHTLFFIGSFSMLLFGFELEKILLVLTTAVSLEAIYLAIFIQIAINRNTQSLNQVEKDIDEIQEDIDEIQEDVDEIQEDVEEIQEDVELIEKDIEEIQEDVEGIESDIEEIHEEEVEDTEAERTRKFFENLDMQLQKLITEVDALKKKQGK